MKRLTLRKICIVLALAALLPLGLASLVGNTLAYLTDSDSVTNGFTFRRLGQSRTNRLNYYYQGSNGNYYQITGNNYQNVQTTFFENELICANSQNTKFIAPPNGFEISYITIRTGQNGAQTRINAGDCAVQSSSNNMYTNVYFAPTTYTITYDFNGYEESDITFTDLPLQTTYTVYDMIRVPYDAEIVADNAYDGFERVLFCILGSLFGGGDSIKCDQNVPGASVDGNTLLGWEDQDGVVHRYDNAANGSSWATDITVTGNNTNVMSATANRQTGDLVLKARWQVEVANPNNANSLRMMDVPELEEMNQELPEENGEAVINKATEEVSDENTSDTDETTVTEPQEQPAESEAKEQEPAAEKMDTNEQLETSGTEEVENGDQATE